MSGVFLLVLVLVTYYNTADNKTIGLMHHVHTYLCKAN